MKSTQIKTARKKVKPIPKLIKELTKVFNYYIRLRDTDRGYGNCISCGLRKSFEELDAGHFFSVRHSKVRFDERNVHAQDISCNRFRADYYKPYYAANLIRKIGLEAFQQLEKDSKETFKWDRKYLEDMIKLYKQKVKEKQTSSL